MGEGKTLLVMDMSGHVWSSWTMMDNDDSLEVVEEVKLLGVILTSNLSWQAQDLDSLRAS